MLPIVFELLKTIRAVTFSGAELDHMTDEQKMALTDNAGLGANIFGNMSKSFVVKRLGEKNNKSALKAKKKSNNIDD